MGCGKHCPLPAVADANLRGDEFFVIIVFQSLCAEAFGHVAQRIPRNTLAREAENRLTLFRWSQRAVEIGGCRSAVD